MLDVLSVWLTDPAICSYLLLPDSRAVSTLPTQPSPSSSRNDSPTHHGAPHESSDPHSSDDERFVSFNPSSIFFSTVQTLILFLLLVQPEGDAKRESASSEAAAAAVRQQFSSVGGRALRLLGLLYAPIFELLGLKGNNSDDGTANLLSRDYVAARRGAPPSNVQPQGGAALAGGPNDVYDLPRPQPTQPGTETQQMRVEIPAAPQQQQQPPFSLASSTITNNSTAPSVPSTAETNTAADDEPLDPAGAAAFEAVQTRWRQMLIFPVLHSYSIIAAFTPENQLRSEVVSVSGGKWCWA